MNNMNTMEFLAEAQNNVFLCPSLHFYTPWIYLECSYSRGFIRDESTGCTYTGEVNEWTTFWNRDTREEIITVPSNIKEISTWDDWEKSFKRSKISQHSPVYRIIKAIFDGKLIAAKDPEDEYGKKYDCDYIKGYEIL